MNKVGYVSPKYGEVHAFVEYLPRCERYELTVFLKLPVHLYDFVDYQPAGKHTTYHSDGRVTEGYHEERVGTQILPSMTIRLDFDWSADPLTEEAVEGMIDEEFRNTIENYDGVVHFEKIIGVK